MSRTSNSGIFSTSTGVVSLVQDQLQVSLNSLMWTLEFIEDKARVKMGAFLSIYI